MDLFSELLGTAARSVVFFALRTIKPVFASRSALLPIGLFTFAQLAVLSASLVLGWILVYRRGYALGMRVKRIMDRYGIAPLALAALGVLLLTGFLARLAVPQLLITAAGQNSYPGLVSLQGRAECIAYTVQTVILAVPTLALARKFTHANHSKLPRTA